MVLPNLENHFFFIMPRNYAKIDKTNPKGVLS